MTHARERDAASIRARLLLDAVIESATGLRRELGLPPVDRGARRRRRGGPGRRARPLRRSERPGDPASLEQLLALPRARLIVDGYNVTKAAWPDAPAWRPSAAGWSRPSAPLVARSGAETTVVFDAAESSARTVMPAPRGVRVVFSPEGVIADDVIRQLVAAEPRGRVVVVVSDDQAVARDVVARGARAVPTSSLLAMHLTRPSAGDTPVDDTPRTRCRWPLSPFRT